MQTNHDTISEQAHALLKKFYGYNSFRPGQLEIIRAAAGGRDAVVLMPTGGGKSLCYQLPALMSDGCTMVISPLIALMNDQVTALVANGIEAIAVHSGRDEGNNRRDIERALNGEVKLVYISPERLLNDLDSWVSRLNIKLIAVDEAHCISQWGHDFRPVYTQLAVVKQRFATTPMMALTATADRLTRDDIVGQLGLNDPLMWVGSFNRPNLSLEVVHGGTRRQQVATITDLIRRHPNDSGIVYTLSRKKAEEMHQALTQAGFRSVVYHAGMSSQARYKAQHAFSDGTAQVVCATIAFGMGIDKSNIRWVVHTNLPGNIESYYQEIGRAGRDGLPAKTILFYTLSDLITREKFIEEAGRPEVASEKLRQMMRYAEAQVCRRRILLSYFSEEMDCDCGNCDVCKNPPARFDGTVLVQKAGSAVLRTDQQVGAGMLVDILRGSARADLLQRGWHLLKTYGVGRDMSNQEWNDYVAQMVQLGIFEVAYEDSNHLRITPFGRKIVYGQATIDLARHQPHNYKTGKKSHEVQVPVSMDPTEQLFEQLKTIRKDVAGKEGVPAYVVFSDTTLLDMAKRRPQTPEQFVEVHGVGERKAVKYGKKFITAIRKFEGLGGTMPKGYSPRETLILLNAGLPVDEIAQIKNISINTVHNHVAELITEGLVTDYARFLTPTQYRQVITAIDAGPEALEALREIYTPGQTAIARAIRQVAPDY